MNASQRTEYAMDLVLRHKQAKTPGLKDTKAAIGYS